MASERREDRTGIFCLTHGDLVIRWPAHLTPNDYTDAVAYLALVSRQMKRQSDRCPYVATADSPPRPIGEGDE